MQNTLEKHPDQLFIGMFQNNLAGLQIRTKKQFFKLLEVLTTIGELN